MADALTNLTTARDNVAQALANMTAAPKPNYTIDGQSVSWNDLFKSYTDALLTLNEQISALDPFEIESIGYT